MTEINSQQVPQEVVCIETLKVYDFCFQRERRDNACFDLCQVQVPEGAVITCEVKNATCKEISRTPPDAQGRSNVSFAFIVTVRVKITKDSTVIFDKTKDFGFTKTVVLCAPAGTFTECKVVNVACGPCIIVGTQVCCTYELCIIFQSLAVVKLLVPTYGFCIPKECEQVLPGPPFVCPPNLFPPQCPAASSSASTASVTTTNVGANEE